MPERICPMCGRSSREVPFIGSLCKDCFVKRYGVARAPDRVEFVYCRSCNAHRARGRWSDPYESLDESLRDYLLSELVQRSRAVEPLQEVAIKSISFQRGEGELIALVEYEGRYGDVSVTEVKAVKVVEVPTLCPVCAARRSGEGYRAVVQVRSYPRPLSEDRDSRRLLESIIRSMGDEVVKIEDVKGGVDVYLRDVQAAKSMAARLRSEAMARIIETVKGGGPKAKVYVSARMLTLRQGDVVEVHGEPMMFLTETPRGLLFVSLATGSRRYMSLEELWDRGFKLYEGPNLKRMTLISRAGGKVVMAGPEGSIEVPDSQVEAFTEGLAEGQEFLVYLSDRRVYVIRREG